MAPMPPMAPRPDDSEPHKISADLPDIESILSLNPRKKEHANVLPTAGNDHKRLISYQTREIKIVQPCSRA